MMSTTKELLNQALDALTYIHAETSTEEDELIDRAITALRTAIEQAEKQEPVAVVSGYYGGQCVVLPTNPARLFNSGTAFYTTPPNVATPLAAQSTTEESSAVASPVQEPLEYWNAVEGWVKIDEVREHFDSVGCGTIYKTAGDGRVPLTAAQRQSARSAWVGLTDEEKQEWVEAMPDEPKPRHIMNLINVIEVELKGRNT